MFTKRKLHDRLALLSATTFSCQRMHEMCKIFFSVAKQEVYESWFLSMRINNWSSTAESVSIKSCFCRPHRALSVQIKSHCTRLIEFNYDYETSLIRDWLGQCVTEREREGQIDWVAWSTKKLHSTADISSVVQFFAAVDAILVITATAIVKFKSIELWLMMKHS